MLKSFYILLFVMANNLGWNALRNKPFADKYIAPSLTKLSKIKTPKTLKSSNLEHGVNEIKKL